MPSQPHRPEIQGLRTIASLLVAVYHIWLGRVSGGVDVFFVVSGFLITRSLLGQVERGGQVRPLAFWGRLIQRLFPCALLILFVVSVSTVIFLPQFRWKATFTEVLASTLYYENWQLSFSAVDYLDRENAKSPVQHYWALAVQGQFYLLWPWVVQSAQSISRRMQLDLNKTLRAVFGLLFLVSFAYSVIRTRQDQPFTYFDTGARIWEFSIGALLAITPIPRLSAAVQATVSWIGLAMIILCGVVLRVSTEFPGYAALWPTTGVALVLVAGATPATPLAATRVLGSRVLAGFGDISYAFYLWHWPLLVFFQFFLEKDEVGHGYGVFILGLSALLAYGTTRWVETPARGSRLAKARPFAFGASWLGVNVLGLVAWGFSIHLLTSAERTIDLTRYPGAAVVRPGGAWLKVSEQPIRPSPLSVKDDLPKMYADKCHETVRGQMPLSCVYGDAQAKTVLALVGSSHAAQWLPALEILAAEKHFKIVTFTRSSCRFGFTKKPSAPTAKRYKCEQWNERVFEELTKLKPNFVFTTATESPGPKERVPESFRHRWEQLHDLGVQVIGIRDNPWFGFDVAECVEKHGRNSDKCLRKRDDVLAKKSPVLTRKSVPPNVHFLDLSDYFCQEDRCAPVIGNVLVYRDKHHITTLYSAQLAPALMNEMLRAKVQL